MFASSALKCRIVLISFATRNLLMGMVYYGTNFKSIKLFLERNFIQEMSMKAIYVPDNVFRCLLQNCQLSMANEVSNKQIKR